MLLVIGIVLFLNLCVLCLLVYRWQSRDKAAVSARMGSYLEQVVHSESSQGEVQAAAPKLSGWRAVVRRLSSLFEVSDGTWSRRVELRLMQAGVPLKSSEFLVICLAAALVGAVLLLRNGILGAMMGGIAGYLLPFLFLRIKSKRRAKAFNNQLGDTLLLIANALKTGYSFMQAIEMVSREMLPPISAEFGRTLKEMNLGVPTEEALSNMAGRVDSDDLDLVVTAVLIQRQVGGNLAEVLTNIAGTIRERIRIKGEIKTLTAQGRMSGVIVSLLPIALLLAMRMINPGYIDLLFTHPIGQMMLGAAVIGQLLGIFAIQKIVNIEV